MVNFMECEFYLGFFLIAKGKKLSAYHVLRLAKVFTCFRPLISPNHLNKLMRYYHFLETGSER